ncbi:MAG: hypothetical protein OFPI_35990 [Osedax symbiont Rs2]|nr:MAG: hypothetical protein OFPI_35990 [Osedax symbiont Rs2]
MYIPEHFAQHDWRLAKQLMRDYSFAQLITVALDRAPCINHIPILYDESEHCLYFHLAAANPDADGLFNSKITAVFSGPQGYISPNWADQLIVPTWNYTALHVQGQVSEVVGGEQKLSVMAQMVDYYEQVLQPSWGLDQLSKVQTEQMLAAIRCFKMPLEQWFAKEKLSQNRSAQATRQIAQNLRVQNYPYQDNLALADLMLS